MNIRTSIVILLFVALTILASSDEAQAQVARTASDFGAQGTAKVMCSAVFVSGRDLDEAVEHSMPESLFPIEIDELHPGSGPNISIDVDKQAHMVRVTAHGFTARAKHYGDQGCVILPGDTEDVYFEPVKVETTLPDAMSQPWPMGDAPSTEPWPAGVDRATVERATDAAFREGGLTAAYVVLYKGQIIAERYGASAHKDMQLESWSMGKSLTATLMGLLIEDGHVGLHDPAPVPRWHEDQEDPRSRIRVSDLLRMSSGLLFTHQSQPRWQWGRAVGDHLYIYNGGIDVFHHAITRPPEFPPNTVGRYRNSDPLTINYIIKQIVENTLGEDYLTWPQKALFDKLGIRKQVLETDVFGNFILSGYDFGTGRNWARLGQLYLQDGVWNGERLLPEGFVDFVSSPAPAWDRQQYGGFFWLNRTGRWTDIPRSAYSMRGAGGQRVVIIPTQDLVVARLGHSRGERIGDQGLNEALGLLVEAVESGR